MANNDQEKKQITIGQTIELMAAEAKNTGGNIVACFNLPDGAVLEIRYRLPKKE